MEGRSRCLADFMRESMPYIGMILLQFGYAGMNTITKISLDRGMSHYVLVVYRHAIATLVIAPFALLLERNVRPKMTLAIFLQISVLGLLGPVIDQNFYYAGLKFTSPTFSCAMSNILPAMTFVLAVLCRMEKVDMKKVRCMAKVVGTLVTVGGAMLMTLYKGNVVNFPWSGRIHPQTASNGDVPTTSDRSERDWFKGSIFLIVATLAWASFFVLQAVTLKRYPAHLSLTALVVLVGTLQSIVVTLAMEHKASVWSIGFDMNLLAAAYAGIVSSSIAYYVQGLVMKKRGPVFVTAFSPLMMIIVAIMGSLILSEKIYLGGVLGGVVIVSGLYSVLWGEYREHREKQTEEKPVGSDPDGVSLSVTSHDDIEAADDINILNASEGVTVAVGGPIPMASLVAMEAPKPHVDIVEILGQK